MKGGVALGWLYSDNDIGSGWRWFGADCYTTDTINHELEVVVLCHKYSMCYNNIT